MLYVYGGSSKPLTCASVLTASAFASCARRSRALAIRVLDFMERAIKSLLLAAGRLRLWRTFATAVALLERCCLITLQLFLPGWPFGRMRVSWPQALQSLAALQCALYYSTFQQLCVIFYPSAKC